MQKFDIELLKQKIAQSFESIAQFCERAGIENPEEFEQNLERGNITPETIKKAANVLEIAPEEIGRYFFNPASDPTEKELIKLYEQLTPENRKLFVMKYYELLAEQEQEPAPESPEYYYFFDCLDGVLSDRYLTARELAQLITGKREPMPEKDIIKTAANYEATLYRYILDANGNPQNEKCLYDPFNI